MACRTAPMDSTCLPEMPRRAFLAIVAGGLLAAPLAAEAQQQMGTPSRIGVLLNLYPPNAHPPQALRQRLRDLGYVEGQNLVIDWRYQQGGSIRFAAVGAEIFRRHTDVIVDDGAA